MLQEEKISPNKIAIDRPSFKFLSFMKKHYNLSEYTPQNNNFVVYDDFFSKKYQSPKIEFEIENIKSKETSYPELEKIQRRETNHPSPSLEGKDIKNRNRNPAPARNKRQTQNERYRDSEMYPARGMYQPPVRISEKKYPANFDMVQELHRNRKALQPNLEPNRPKTQNSTFSNYNQRNIHSLDETPELQALK